MNGFDISTISSVYVGSTQYNSIYYGSNLIWPINQTLPYDAELEYLESSGTQYINTTYEVWNHGLSGEIKMQRTGNSTGEKAYVGRSASGGFDLYTKSGSGIGLWIEAERSLDLISSSTYFDKNIHTVQFEIRTDGSSLTVDGDTYTTSHSYSNKSKSGIQLFSHRSYYNSEGRIYYCKLWDNGVLVLDLIPVRVGQVGYMYDKISGTLFGNSGSGDFILGPDKDVPKGYTKLQYISSTNNGNQYIDLGIKLYDVLNKDYDIAIKFIIDTTNTEGQATIFNCQDPNNSPWPGTYIRKNNSGSNITGRYIGGSAKDNTIGQLGNIIELPVQTAPNKNVTNLNNNNSTHQYGAGLFCSFSDTNNTPQRYCNGTIYYFKLFVEGTLVRDMVPCKNPNDVVGMYDVVNRVFYSSPNGAAFVAGPEV